MAFANAPEWSRCCFPHPLCILRMTTSHTTLLPPSIRRVTDAKWLIICFCRSLVSSTFITLVLIFGYNIGNKLILLMKRTIWYVHNCNLYVPVSETVYESYRDVCLYSMTRNCADIPLRYKKQKSQNVCRLLSNLNYTTAHTFLSNERCGCYLKKTSER